MGVTIRKRKDGSSFIKRDREPQFLIGLIFVGRDHTSKETMQMEIVIPRQELSDIVPGSQDEEEWVERCMGLLDSPLLFHDADIIGQE